MSRRSELLVRRAQVLALTAAVAVLLTGCIGAEPDPTASATTPSASPTATTTATAAPTPSEPTLVPDGTAADNLAFFASIVEGVWAGPQRAEGRAYIDALTAAGFDRAKMQVTEDESTVGNPAESIQFSVQWDDADCLVGQVGPATGDPVAAVLPVIAEGGCLIGKTRPIDW